jgi:hypothetical protein
LAKPELFESDPFKPELLELPEYKLPEPIKSFANFFFLQKNGKNKDRGTMCHLPHMGLRHFLTHLGNFYSRY